MGISSNEALNAAKEIVISLIQANAASKEEGGSWSPEAAGDAFKIVHAAIYEATGFTPPQVHL